MASPIVTDRGPSEPSGQDKYQDKEKDARSVEAFLKDVVGGAEW